MQSSLVECVPNFSEARRPQVVQAIHDSILQVPGVHVLDQHSDLDHNRTVFTFCGSPESVEEAAFQSIRCASELINLNLHHGEHPRIGAADVVPFIPLGRMSIHECVEIARRLGRRVAEELLIPVYLYEEAATLPERRNLEYIRRGEYEVLKTIIGVDPSRKPDFGPAVLGPAGATVIGARQFLIAFNVFLSTNDVTIAQNIAKIVRNSSGGLRYVKAMGVLVNNHAQVSMNLTNFHQSSLARTVEMIRREAAQYGASILQTELVGLIPQEALVDSAAWYLQLGNFKSQQILETRLSEIQTIEPDNHNPAAGISFLDKLANNQPVPAGGSASAYAGAMAAALVTMIARTTLANKKYLPVAEPMHTILEKSEKLRQEMTEVIDLDAASFLKVIAARKLPKNNEQELEIRKSTIEQATLQAIRIPLDACHKAVDILTLVLLVVQIGNFNALTDAINAGLLASTCLKGSANNVKTNLSSLPYLDDEHHFLKEVEFLEQKGLALSTNIEAAFAGRKL